MRSNFQDIFEKTKTILIQTPLLWVIVGIFINYSMPALNTHLLEWNIVELDIAQNIIHGNGYVVDIASPPAVWRPPLIPLLSIPILYITNNPTIVFTAIYLLSIVSLAVFLFYSAKLLYSCLPAHAASFLAISTTAMGATLAKHTHGFSHIGFMLFVGPAIYVTIRALRFNEKKSLLAAGLLYALLYLSRPESLILFGIALVFIAFSRIKSSIRKLVISCCLALIPFIAIAAPYEILKARATQQYDLYPSGLIANFYNSEGWATLHNTDHGDIEGQGWLRAIQKYGRPQDNHYSVPAAIRSNPTAFQARLDDNIFTFEAILLSRKFFNTHMYIFLLFLPFVIFKAGPILEFGYLLCCSMMPLLFLLLHVTDRYTSPVFPFLVLLVAGGIHGVQTLFCKASRHIKYPRLANSLLAVALLTYLVIAQTPLILKMQQGAQAQSPSAEELLGTFFLKNHENTKAAPAVLDVMDIDADGCYVPINVKLISYYAHTAINWGQRFQLSKCDDNLSDDEYPRSKIFSMTDKEVDYYFVGKSVLLGTDFLLLPYRAVSFQPVVVAPDRMYYLFEKPKGLSVLPSKLDGYAIDKKIALEKVLAASYPDLRQ